MLNEKNTNSFEERLLIVIMIIFVIRGAIFMLTGIDNITEQAIAVLVYTIFVIAIYLKPYRDASAMLINAHFGLLMLMATGFNLYFQDLDFLYYIIIIQFITSLSVKESIFWFPIFSSLIVIDGITDSGFAQGITDGLSNSTLLLFMIILGNALRRARHAQEESARLLTELSDANEQLKEYASKIEEYAIAEERNRLSRDLHDTLGHRLTVSIVQLEGAEHLISRNPELAIERVHKVGKQLTEGLSELRQTVAMLRTPTGIDLSLPVALKQLAHNFSSATNLRIHVSVPDSISPLSDARRMALYRATQEALTNIQRHAMAQDVWLSMKTTTSKIELSVSDNGIGPTEHMDQQGFGLRGMRERIQKIGGELSWTPNGDTGTLLRINIPIYQKEGAIG